MCHRIRGLDSALAVVQVDQHIFVVAHAELPHVAELAMAVSGLDSLHQVVVVFFLERVYEIYAGLGVTTGAAATPSQSQETDMLRSTLMYAILPAK